MSELHISDALSECLALCDGVLTESGAIEISVTDAALAAEHSCKHPGDYRAHFKWLDSKRAGCSGVQDFIQRLRRVVVVATSREIPARIDCAPIISLIAILDEHFPCGNSPEFSIRFLGRDNGDALYRAWKSAVENVRQVRTAIQIAKTAAAYASRQARALPTNRPHRSIGKSGAERNGRAPREGDRKWSILRAAEELGALSLETRRTAAEISLKAFGKESEIPKRVFSALVKDGKLNSLRDGGGGYWLPQMKLNGARTDAPPLRH